ncbi:hypothetical protein BGX26_006008 [Mortierella sp. AD094]|nr:hypothetical protein BGX26_006008 [Mortierella sp. AD094]
MSSSVYRVFIMSEQIPEPLTLERVEDIAQLDVPTLTGTDLDDDDGPIVNESDIPFRMDWE